MERNNDFIVRLMELQGLPVTKAVIYRNVDRNAWEQIAKEHQGVRVNSHPLAAPLRLL